VIDIYFADDSPLILDVLRSSFSHDDQFNIVGSSRCFNGLIERLSVVKPDILITDVSMPHSNSDSGAGRGNISKEIKSIVAASPDTQICVLSHSANYALIRKLKSFDILGYIVKDDDLASPRVFSSKIKEAYLKRTKIYSNRVIQLMQKNEDIRLTDRQIEIMQVYFANQDKSLKQIATTLAVSESAVREHMRKVKNMLNVFSTIDALKALMELGYISPMMPGVSIDVTEKIK
jgi:DNA-binding NarL/FixJ family response regulator